MRSIAELCTGNNPTCSSEDSRSHFDAVLKQNDEARRFLAGNIHAELASQDVEGFVHAGA